MNELSRIAAILGRKGGKNKAKKYGKKHMREIGRKGALKRWKMYQKKLSTGEKKKDLTA